MALGPLAGGLIYDRYGSYGWLYICSVVFGLGAAAIMLTFRPRQTTPSGPALGHLAAE